MWDVVTPEMRLFKSVIIEAARDAFINKNHLNKDEALSFFQGGRDFYDVCDFAGVDSTCVLRIANDFETTQSEKFNLIKRLVE